MSQTRAQNLAVAGLVSACVTSRRGSSSQIGYSSSQKALVKNHLRLNQREGVLGKTHNHKFFLLHTDPTEVDE